MSSFSVDVDVLPTAILAIPLVEGGNNRWLVARFSLEELWRMVDKIRVGRPRIRAGHRGRRSVGRSRRARIQVARGAGFKTVSHPLMAAETLAASDSSDSSQDFLEYPDWAIGRNGGLRVWHDPWRQGERVRPRLDRDGGATDGRGIRRSKADCRSSCSSRSLSRCSPC